MSTIEIIAAYTEESLEKLGQQISFLDQGLRSAIPAEKEKPLPNSILYLSAGAEALQKSVAKCRNISQTSSPPSTPRP